MYKARATFRLWSPSKYSFERAVELGRLRLETRDGRICGEVEVEVEELDFDLVEKKVLEELDRVSSLLTLVFEEGFAVGDVEIKSVTATSAVAERGEGVVEVSAHVFSVLRVEASIEVGRRLSQEKLSKVEEELRELEDRLSRLKICGDLLRAIRWWRKGYLEEDKVDRFLDYYIALEMLASLTGYKGKGEGKDKKCRCRSDGWLRRFSEDYSITYKPDGKTSISDIRNRLVHAPGPEKDEAEELARLYADRFGAEVLRAIKKIIEECGLF